MILSNGNMLVCLDEWGQVRDFFFPRVGQENHAGEPLRHKIGVHTDGVMSWLDGGAFVVTVRYVPDTLVSEVEARHKTDAYSIYFTDLVYNETDIFVRQVRVVNHSPVSRKLKFFFNQQFHISEYARGDTAYFSPDLHALVHYKGKRVFSVSLHAEAGVFDDYAVGLTGIEGKEGTWKDAEDGILSKQPIEHGSVDSVVGKSIVLAPNATAYFSYWICAAKSHRDVEKLHRDVLVRGPEHLRRTTEDYWRAWVNRREITKCDVEPQLLDLYKRSLLIMRAHVDNRGAIIASSDSSLLQNGRDTYCYFWPRDAAYTALAFLHAGHTTASNRLHLFLNNIITDHGYLLHKFRPDGSLGSSWHPWIEAGRSQPPIQEDETAITLVSLYEQYLLNRDVEYIEKVYNSYIKLAAGFLCRYRDKKTGLPLPSHNLWEDAFGVFTYTAATVYGGLTSAAAFAKLLGKQVAHERWSAAAEEVKAGILTHLVHEDGRVMKQIRHTAQSRDVDPTVDASSWYGLFRFGILPVRDHLLERAYELARDTLTLSTPVGGMARYEGDQYFKRADVIGNPWIITTLWLAEYEVARATTLEDLVSPYERLRWVGKRASPAGLLSEQYDPFSGEPVSAAPLVWSHAGYVLAFLAYLEKLEALTPCAK